jgi:hypothetical protein
MFRAAAHRVSVIGAATCPFGQLFLEIHTGNVTFRNTPAGRSLGKPSRPS